MRILSGFLAVGLIAGLSATATAETNGWYVSAGSGVSFVPELSLKDAGGKGKLESDIGYDLLGAAGYGFGKYRLELEGGWRQNDLSKLKTSGLTFKTKGDVSAFTTMLNGIYDVRTGTAWSPYFGVGVGTADVLVNKASALGTKLIDDSNWAFAYQGILGLSYAVNDKLSLNGDYRYLRTTEFDLKESVPVGGKSKQTYEDHAIIIGFTYKFGEPEAAPAPAPAPVPMAAPAPKPAPKPMAQVPLAKSFLVFFDFDKSDITAEAAKIINQAAAAAKDQKSTSVQLIGHTDLSGSEKYNLALSLRRANAVKAALVKLGIPADEIGVIGKGKSEPLVATKDGVREPQNRRVQILLP